MDALRPIGNEGDTSAAVLAALAGAQGQAVSELITMLGSLSGDPNPLTFFGTGAAACERAGKDFDALQDTVGLTYEEPHCKPPGPVYGSDTGSARTGPVSDT